MSSSAIQSDVDARLLHLSAALLVEKEVRTQRTIIGLAHYLVNETARIHNHKLAFLLRPKRFGLIGPGWKTLSASDVTSFDDASPLGDWLRKIAANQSHEEGVRISETASLALPDDLRAGLPNHVLVMPLAHPDGGMAGLLLLLRTEAWDERDRLLAEPLAECYGHALVSLDDRPWMRGPKNRFGRFVMLCVGAIALAAGAWPIPLTSLAPAEVVAATPIPITAPFDGIVTDFDASPYAAVSTGQVIAHMDGAELTMQRDIAQKTLAVSKAELEQHRHQAFLDPDAKTKLAVGEKKVALRGQSLANAEEKLSRHRIVAPGSGIVVYDNRFDWQGRPVKAGQLLMTLADPKQLEVQIDLPVANLIPLKEGAEVTLFLDMAPSTPVKARLSRIGFLARNTPDGIMAYRYAAELTDGQGDVVLGARGTARLKGETVSLAYALLRRPIAAVRQFFGL